MKKVLALLIALVMAVSLCACQKVETTSDKTQPSMFVVIEEAPAWEVVYQKDTKVMYAVSCDGGYNCGNFTLMVNPDGSPMIYEG